MSALADPSVAAGSGAASGPEDRARARRRRLRRRLLIAGLLPLVLALAFSVEVAITLRADHSGRAAYGEADFTGARESFAGNRSLNLLEPWISPYDEGTARYRLGDYAGAARLLAEALALAPAEQRCRVRINLALAHEAIGDSDLADGAVPAARARWLQGTQVLETGLCLVVSRDPALVAGSANEEQGVVSGTIDARLRDKLRDPTAESDPGDPPPDTSAAELLTELNERSEQRRRRAEQDQQDQQDKDDQAVSPSTSTGPDAPPVNQW